MHNAAHDVVVAQREQVPALGRPRVPAAQADGPLVRQQHVVLRVVEDGLRPVHLPPAQASACAETRVSGLGAGASLPGSHLRHLTALLLLLAVPI